MWKFLATKKILILGLILLGLFFVVAAINAQTIDPNFGQQSGLASASLTTVVARIINAALGLLGLIAVGLIIYGGFLYMTARGEAERVQKAKKLLVQAAIGLLIIAMSFAIANFLFFILGGGAGGGGTTGNGNIIPPGTCTGPFCGCTGPGCGPSCPNPTQGSDAPWICSVKPAKQAKGGLLTIRGGNFGDYIQGSSKVSFIKEGDSTNKRYEGVIASCGTGKYEWNKDGSLVIKVIVPDSLPFDESATASNKFKVYVENSGKMSIDYSQDLMNLRNVFTLTKNNPSPEIICLDPNFGPEGTAVKVIGKFLGTQTDNKLVFNKSIEATATAWTPDQITATVPVKAIHGEAFIAAKTTNKQLSDGLDFWVTCNNTTSPYDCQSGCCRKTTSYASNLCDLSKYCGISGIGAKCNGGAGCVATDPACNPGLTCDKCICREPQINDPCSSSTTSCVKDDVKCGQDLICANDCTCQSATQITAVTPGNGAPGNYITITGKGFGDMVWGPNLLGSDYNPDFETTATGKWHNESQHNPPIPPFSPEKPGVQYTFSDQAYSGKQSLYKEAVLTDSWYQMFGFRDIKPLLTAGKRYIFRFRYKGFIDHNFEVLMESGGLGGGGSRNHLLGIIKGNYNDWQTYQAIFTFTSDPSNPSRDLQNWPTVDIGLMDFWPSYVPATSQTKIYLDDFELLQIPDNFGQVDFCGIDTNADDDKCGDDDDKIAKFPFETNTNCPFDSSWQNNEIIVVAPAGGVSGPIKVTTVSGLSDQTAPAPNLPAIPDFQFNDTKRPALCGLAPNQGSYLSSVRALGNSFGTVSGGPSGGFVYLGNPDDKKQFNAVGTWTDQIINGLVVPNFKASVLSVWVKVAAELSNPISFKILKSANQPTIDNIDPKQGPNGQYITIQGSGFGSVAGTVKFRKIGDDAAAAKNWQNGDIDFPNACAAKYWSDSQIIIKVPNYAETAISAIAVITKQGVQSNVVNFNHCVKNNSTCLLTPGICAIVPNKAPVATNVVIYGDNFGTYAPVNRIIFFNNQAVYILPSIDLAWKNQQIGTSDPTILPSPVNVPEQTQTGPVTVKDSFGIISNKYNFEVADCRTDAAICTDTNAPCCQQDGVCKPAGDCQSTTGTTCEYKYTFTTGKRIIEPGLPEVVENSNCDQELNQSPSPWKDPSNDNEYACVNAQIYARFNQAMDEDTLTEANITVASCNADKTVCDGVVTSSPDFPIITELDSIAFTPSDNLSASTWYKVTLNGAGIKSAADPAKFLDGDKDGVQGGDYVWYFRTKDSEEICKVETVNVTPNDKVLNLLTLTQVYTARARAANCNILAGVFNWEWYTKSSQPGEKEPKAGEVAVLTDISVMKEGVATVINGQQLATPLKQGIVYIGAELEQLADDKNKLTIDLNIPVITDFYHKDGVINDQVNSYVTISGLNFGDKQGESKVYFENTSADPAKHWTEAQVANCALAWTDTEVKVIVPKDVIATLEGSWIKIVTPFGEDTTDGLPITGSTKIEDGIKVSSEAFHKSDNLYPFICQLNPNFGKEGISVTAVGDNFGDKYRTTYKGKEYGVGSYVNFAGQIEPFLAFNKIKTWTNKAITYANPLGDLASPEVPVYVSIDPYSEPFNSSADSYTCSESNLPPACTDTYADTNEDGQYNKAPYTVDNNSAPNLVSNSVIFYQPPVITSISPDNGPAKQWITIYGKNFSTYVEGDSKIFFRKSGVKDTKNADGTEDDPQTADGDIEISLAACETTTWFNDHIIAKVPEEIAEDNYSVYIITATSFSSNKDKTFTVNQNPLGAGLCSIDPTMGKADISVEADGERFDDVKGDNNIVFSSKLNAITATWADTNILANVPPVTQSGPVYVNKKVVIGQKCAGFSVGSWCPSDQYDNIYQDVPSNSLPFEVPFASEVDCQYPVLTLAARDQGFPLTVFTRNPLTGVKSDFNQLSLANIATDGTYIYTMGRYNSSAGNLNVWSSSPDTVLTIYQIGTGYNQTELGRFYKKYQFSGKYYLPISPSQYSSTPRTVSPPYLPELQLIATPDGLFVQHAITFGFAYKTRDWLPTTDVAYNKPFIGITKIKFNDDNTYDWQIQEIPQGINGFLFSTGSNILIVRNWTPSGGYTIDILDNNFKLTSSQFVKNADIKQGDPYYGSGSSLYAFKAQSQIGLADQQYLYLEQNGNGITNVINWRSGTWAGFIRENVAWQTHEYWGAYDWVNNKYWYGQSSYHASAALLAGYNHLVRYSQCPITKQGFCRTDLDCKLGTRCPNSKCLNNQCTPEVRTMTPTTGPVGQWLSITGCYFGCDPGNVYFTAPSSASVKMPTNGLLIGYDFKSSEDNGKVAGSIPSGSLVKNANIDKVNGVLKLPTDTDLLDLNDALSDPAKYGGEESGKMTLFVKFKLNDTVFTGGNWTNFLSSVGAIAALWFYPKNLSTAPFTAITYGLNDAKHWHRWDSDWEVITAEPLTAQQWNSLVIVVEAGVGSKYYINGKLTNQHNDPGLRINSRFWLSNAAIGVSGGKFKGEVDDFYVYNRAFTDAEILTLSSIKGLTPSDQNGTCENNWSCAADLKTAYDFVRTEVPNIKTSDKTDDAVKGPVALKTSKGAYVKVGDFDVTNASISGNQICKINNCGNGNIDGTCSDPTKTTEAACIVTPKYTWDYNRDPKCSNPDYNNKTLCEAEMNIWQLEQCDGNPVGAVNNFFAPEYKFAPDQTCDLYGAPPDCQLKCNLSCNTVVCNNAGENCTACGNGIVDGFCSDPTKYSKVACEDTPKYTWDAGATPKCSSRNPADDTDLKCLTTKHVWTSEDCDCGNGNGSCSNPAITSWQKCVTTPKNTWENNACTPQTEIKSQKACLAEKNTWTCNASLGTCADKGWGEGNLGCQATTCKFDASACSEAPTPPLVEKTLPENNENAFCRNGIIDIYFNELIDPATINQDNFVIGRCGGPVVKNSQGLLTKAGNYFKNIFLKLIGYKTNVLAAPEGCGDLTLLATGESGDYQVSYSNIGNTWYSRSWDSKTSTCSDKNIISEVACVSVCSDPSLSELDCVPKTVVYLELADPKIFEPNTTYNVGVKPGVKDLAGNSLDLTNTYLNLKIGGNLTDAYAFKFTTLSGGDSNGICDVDNLQINVYHDRYVSENSRVADLNKESDLFRCAGKNDCAWPEVTAIPTVPADYDQDNKTSGNQHIYKAVGTVGGNAKNFHLSVNYRWIRSDVSDPAKMLSLINPFEDTNAEQNIVQNGSGIVYATASPQPDKENTGLLIVDAQARASTSDPYYKLFRVDYFDCAYPWFFPTHPADTDPVPYDCPGGTCNAKTWYCLDKPQMCTDALCSTPDLLARAGIAVPGAMPAVAGVCGDNARNFPAADSRYPDGGKLCLRGTADPANPNFPAELGTVTWSCNGIAGGASVICTASRALTRVNAVCGDNARYYSDTESAYPAEGVFCSTNTPPATTPAFPGAGASVTWTCPGSGSGNPATCTASKCPSGSTWDNGLQKCKRTYYCSQNPADLEAGKPLHSVWLGVQSYIQTWVTGDNWIPPGATAILSDIAALAGECHYQCPPNNVVIGNVCQLCGNGTKDPGELCDDGNVNNVDSCDNICHCHLPSIEYNGGCQLCGNGTLDTGEACDDGNLTDTDACTNNCTWSIKTDSVVMSSTLILPGSSNSNGLNFDVNNVPETSVNAGGKYIKTAPVSPTPYIWVADSVGSTISKIRTFTGVKITKNGPDITAPLEQRGQLIGVYPTGGAWPSRTAVNVETGDVWVANRDGNSVRKFDIDGVVKKTCTTGFSTPRGVVIEENGDVWIANSDSDNLVKLSGDDTNCDIQATVAAGDFPYGLAIDGNNDVWVVHRTAGGAISKLVTATVGTQNVVIQHHATSGNPYGIAIDKNDNVWVGDWIAASSGVWFVPQGAAADFTPQRLALPNVVTGVAVDIYDNIWTSAHWDHFVYKLKPNDSNNSAFYSVSPGYYPHGIAGDSAGQIWAVSRGTKESDASLNSRLTVFNAISGAIALDPGGQLAIYCINKWDPDTDGVVNRPNAQGQCPAAQPYTYSDMTGLNRAMAIRSGTYRVILDGDNTNQHWGRLQWTQRISEPDKETVIVSVRASNSLPITSDFVAWDTWNNPTITSPRPYGRYVEIKVVLRSRTKATSPVFYDLMIVNP